MTYPSGKVVARSYSDRDELSSVKYDGNDVITRTYDDGGRLTSTTYGNGLVESRTYRNDNLTSTIGIPSVTSFSYGWDANKNKTAETDGIVNAYSWSTGTTGYDALDRLVGWNRTNGDSQSWNLTKVGDWTSTTVNGTAETRTHDGVHQLTAQGANALAYDPKGNLTRNACDTADRYAWDFNNKLKSADTNTDGTNDVLFAYDALGRRTAKTSGGNTTVYVSSLNQEIAEYVSGAAANASTYEYVFGDYVDEVLLRVTIATGTKHYYHQDSLYCVRALSDSTGAVTERYAYDPYGRAIYLTAAGALAVPQASTVGNTILYTGRRLDPETSLYYYRARYHDPVLGRFVGRDPVGYRDGVALYRFVRNSPLLLIDPEGKQVENKNTKKCLRLSRPWKKKYALPTLYIQPWLTFDAETQVNIDMWVETCKWCCYEDGRGEYNATSVEIGASGGMTVELKLTGGIRAPAQLTKWVEDNFGGDLEVDMWAGIQGRGTVDMQVSAKCFMGGCDDNPWIEGDQSGRGCKACISSTWKAELAGGGNLEVSWNDWEIVSVGMEIYGNASTTGEICFTIDKDFNFAIDKTAIGDTIDFNAGLRGSLLGLKFDRPFASGSVKWGAVP